MGVSTMEKTPWESVLELTKIAHQKGMDPFMWAMQVSSKLVGCSGVSMPSTELAHILVSYICWDNNVPLAWKFLEAAFALNMVPPLLVLALLSVRVIPCRQSRPGVFRLYMELLKRHALKLYSHITAPGFQNVMMSIDNVLGLSETFGSPAAEPEILLVGFVFTTLCQLLDALLDDEGLLELTPEKKSIWVTNTQEMDVEAFDNFDEKKFEALENLRSVNSLMAVDIIGQFLQNRVTSRILYLIRDNMPKQWATVTLRFEVIATNSSVLRKSKSLSPEMLLQLILDANKVSAWGYKSSLEEFGSLMSYGSLSAPTGFCQQIDHSSMWLPLDVVLEDAVDGYQVTATSAVEVITGLVKSLQAINKTAWHDTFLALWIAALRFVQRFPGSKRILFY